VSTESRGSNRRPRPVPRGPSSLRSQVLGVLREAILSGTLEPGQRLKQDELCTRFGLSPTPVREALRDLESEGLVNHLPHRGVVVAEITAEELLGLLAPVRVAIESFALPIAADRMSEEEWGDLEEIVAAMGRAAERADTEELNALDVRFHDFAIAAARSPQADQLWRSVLPRVRLQFTRLAPRHRAPTEIHEEHVRLLAALKTGEPEVITASLVAHILVSAQELLERAD
jgi:DNA-binding GntR family transcriptional regulator